MSLSTRNLLSLSVGVLLTSLVMPVSAQEVADADSATVATEQAASSAAASEDETFPLPDDLEAPEQYLELVAKIASENEPAENTAEAVNAFNLKFARTIIKLTDKVSEMKPKESTELKGFFFRLQALQILDSLGESGTGEKLEKLIDKLRTDKRSEFQSLGIKFYMEAGLGRWPSLSQEEKQEMLASLISFLKQGEMDDAKLNTVSTVSSVWQQLGDAEMASTLIEAVLPKLEASGNPMLISRAEAMRAELRLLKLPGNEVQLTGTLLDGTEFDWNSYRGKVVLIDFWATWCPPCRAEFPNMRKQYERYKDKGFEIVGVSLDDDRGKLEEFVETNDLPWLIMFNKDEENPENDHPNARYYGISGIPQTILVDTKGKVVSLNAMGEELSRLLEKLLGQQGNPLADKPESDADPS